MLVHVLGAAAGGGFPQWNCNCPNCHGLRQGTMRTERRTQSSIAVSDGLGSWVLCNASPDILQQLQEFPSAQPARELRDSAISAIVLIDSQIDHSTGLLMLRESQKPLRVYCTEAVHQDLTTGNPLFQVLSHYCQVDWQPLRFTEGRCEFTVPEQKNLRWTAYPLKSKAPPYSPHRQNSHVGDTIGLHIQDLVTKRSLFYAPGLGEIEPSLPPIMAQSDCLMVDGTFWQDDEMIRLGINQKKGRDLGHLPQSGPGGMIEVLAAFSTQRKILIHINNTNPILNEDSVERRELTQKGIEVAYDKMEIDV